LDSGPGPEGPSRNDGLFFPQLWAFQAT